MRDTAALLAAAKQGQTLGGGGVRTHLGPEVAVTARGAEGVVTTPEAAGTMLRQRQNPQRFADRQSCQWNARQASQHFSSSPDVMRCYAFRDSLPKGNIA